MKLFLYSIILASAVNMAPVSTARAAERADIPEKYKWDTTDLYPTEDAWRKEADAISARIPALAALQGKLGESAFGFYDALEAVTKLDMDLVRLQTYASMRASEDTRVGKTRGMDQAASDMAVKYASVISFMRPEILAMGAEKVADFLSEEKRLAPYKPWLDDILRYESHTRTAAEEKIAAQAALMSDGPSSTFTTFTNADMPSPEITLTGGKKVRLDASAYMEYRELPDREDRDKVFRTFWSQYKDFERTLGTTLNAQIRVHLFDKEAHKFDSCLSAALFESNVPATVYKRLIADVHANLPTLHRYLKLRRRMMGVGQLRYEDLYAPLVKKIDQTYKPEQAMDLVLQAVAPLGPEYAAELKKGYEHRWVDFMPSTGKDSGAYSIGVYGVHPYQLQNFTGLYEEVSTLAHESGHSMHTFLSDKTQPYSTHEYKIFVAEVASTLNENLLFHHMLDKSGDRNTRLYLLGTYLEGLRTTLFRQTLFAEFELRIHEMAEQGEPIIGENLSRIYLSLLKEYYGDAAGICKINDLYGIEWAYIPHFYNDFYVYQYATSITASAEIASAIRAEAASAGPAAHRDAYLKMLSSGSSKYPVELLKDAGVDMLTSEPFNAAMKEMNGIMDEIEKLLDKPPAL